MGEPFYVPRNRVRALGDEERRLSAELADPALGLDRRAVILRRIDEIDAELLDMDPPA